MAAPPNGSPWPTVDELIEAYESAQARDGHAELDEFLPPAGHPEYLEALCELIRVDLEYQWQRGRPTRLEDYRDRFPDLFRDRDRVREIAFEEYRLRRQAGESPSPQEYRQRFDVESRDWPSLPPDLPGPSDPRDDIPGADGGIARAATAYRAYRLGQADDPTGLEGLFASRRVARGPAELFRELHEDDPVTADRLARAVAAMPRPGGEFLGFQLGSELGRGAFGRVFLARQGELADRPVALKVSANVADETRTLAQLQHTNIVPIHSVHRLGALQAICMPYLGSITLADVLADLRRQPTLPDSGAGLLHSSRARTRPAEQPSPTLAAEPPAVVANGSQARASAQVERLRGLGYVQAVLWIGARLADGLAHAHERGILHRDLKPANVLLADDGEPLLLDFNMAADTKLRGHAAAALVGGTLPYMAPEHLDAFAGARRPVDARSDLYALGVILFELLAGRHPFPMPRGPVATAIPRMIADRQGAIPDLRAANPKVSPAVASIVRQCLEPDPERRYPDARALQEDLQRQLDDLPLKHAPEPSVRERLGKWARRHPRLTSGTTVGIVAACLLVALAAGFLARQGRLRRLEAAAQRQRLADDLNQADVLLGDRDADPRQLAEGIAQCRAALAPYCVLEDPSWPSGPLVAALAADDRAALRRDVGWVLWLWARAELWRAEVAAEPATRAERIGSALRLNTRAGESFGRAGAPGAWWLQRADLAERAGRPDEARSLRDEARDALAATPRERLLTISEGLGRLSRGDALAFIGEISRHDPQNFANWLRLGNLYVQLGKTYDDSAYLDEADHCYSVGIALRPDIYWAHLNRGLLALDREDYPRARDDFGRVLALRPALPAAFLNRALARLGLGDPRGAVADLTRALDSKDAPTQALFLRARARALLGDQDGAARDRAEGLRRTPVDEVSWIVRGLARLATDPRAALADFDAALALNPRSRSALQNKANALSEHLGRPAESIRVLDRALEYHPGSVKALAGRGVLHARLGHRDAALRDARAVLDLDDGALTLYQVACIYALTSRQAPGDRPEALKFLATALRKGPEWLKVAPDDPDLAPVRDRPEFRDLLRAAAVVVRDEDGTATPLSLRRK